MCMESCGQRRRRPQAGLTGTVLKTGGTFIYIFVLKCCVTTTAKFWCCVWLSFRLKQSQNDWTSICNLCARPTRADDSNHWQCIITHHEQQFYLIWKFLLHMSASWPWEPRRHVLFVTKGVGLGGPKSYVRHVRKVGLGFFWLAKPQFGDSRWDVRYVGLLFWVYGFEHWWTCWLSVASFILICFSIVNCDALYFGNTCKIDVGTTCLWSYFKCV